MAPFACIGFIWFYHLLHPLTKYHLEVVPSTLMLIYTFWYYTWLWSLQGRVCDFAVTDVVFLLWLMISLRRPSAAACARLVRWQLMHRWPGASAQFEHLWGQRIGILSMYDSRANGLMRLLGMKLPILPRSWGEWQWVKLDTKVSSRLPFSELERGGHPKFFWCSVAAAVVLIRGGSNVFRQSLLWHHADSQPSYLFWDTAQQQKIEVWGSNEVEFSERLGGKKGRICQIVGWLIWILEDIVAAVSAQ